MIFWTVFYRVMVYPDFFQNKHQKIQKTQKRQNERFLKGFEQSKPDKSVKNGLEVKNHGVGKKNALYPESKPSCAGRSRLQNGDQRLRRALGRPKAWRWTAAG
jgi:hypothetical protein